ncbi:MAG: hypothetical protein JWN34_5065 [Bryobacterales bacterium]|nr:hypothetical protein [Bryobacterales bacterium]
MSPIAEKWMECRQPNCAATLLFRGTAEQRIELAERGDLEGICPIHGNQPVPWALQMEFAQATAQPASAENVPARRAADRRKPPHRCVIKSTRTNTNTACA